MNVASPTAGLRAAMVTCSGLSAIVTLPLLGLALRADERFNPYFFGALRAEQPLSTISHPLEMLPLYVELGNFRPLGRIIEHANYLLQYQIFAQMGAPMNIAVGITRLVSITLLGATTTWFAHRLTRSRTADARLSTVPWLVAFVFPAILTYSGNTSSFVVFSALYFQSTVLLLLLAAAFTWQRLYRPNERLSWPQVAGFVLIGAVAAGTNELVYLAVPVAAGTIALLARHHDLPVSQLVRAPIGRAGIAATAGFAAVFVPARVAILRACTGPEAACYAASEVTLSGWSPALLGARILAGTPLPTLWMLRYSSELRSFAPSLAVLLLLVLAVALAWRRGDLLREHPAGSGAGSGPAIIGVALVLAAALLSSLSGAVQTGNPFASWREDPVALVGWSLFVAGLLDLVGRRLAWRRAFVVPLAVLVLLASVTSCSSNVARQTVDRNDPRSQIADRLAVEASSFDRSDEGNERRCRLLDEFDRLHEGLESQQERLRWSLDGMAQHRHGTDFCEGNPHGR